MEKLLKLPDAPDVPSLSHVRQRVREIGVATGATGVAFCGTINGASALFSVARHCGHSPQGTSALELELSVLRPCLFIYSKVCKS